MARDEQADEVASLILPSRGGDEANSGSIIFAGGGDDGGQT